MTAFALRIAFSASVLALTAGAALSANSPSGAYQVSAAGTACSVTRTPPAATGLYTTGPNARHANNSRVRYTAAHAMPATRSLVAVNAITTCGLAGKDTGTALD